MALSNSDIIKQELEAVFKEAVALYESSGKKASGNWPKGKDIREINNGAELWSYAYLAGRGPTRNGNRGEPTLQQRILEWLQIRGIKPIEQKMKISTLAFLIARKIHREGTDKKRHLAVFEKVLTPQRIQEIIDKVSEMNLNQFVKDTRVKFEKLSSNI